MRVSLSIPIAWIGFITGIFLIPLQLQAQIDRPVGTNLAAIRDWGTEFVFVDVFKQCRAWIPHETGFNKPWSSGVSIPLRADGYPREIPYDNGTDPVQQVRTLMYCGDITGGYPTGSYRLMAQGRGQIRLWGSAVSGTFKTPLDTILTVIPSTGCIYLEIDSSDVSNPVHDIHFVMPGHHQSFQQQPFHPDLLSYVQDYQVIRFMNWMATNGSPVQTWADRNLPDYYSQTLSNGVAYEHIIQLCNATHKNPWINIPHQADSMFIVQLARLFRDSLNPCLKIYLEYSNEVWNGIFAAHSYAGAQGLALGYSGQSWTRAWKYTAKRSADLFQIFEDQFSNDDRFVKVVASQAANDWVTNYILERFSEPLYNPTGISADAIAIGPYFGGSVARDIENAGNKASVTVADILDSLEKSIPVALARMDRNKIVADTHGLKLIAYEGGQHLVSSSAHNSDTAWVNKLARVNRHPDMQRFYCEYFDYWYDSTQADLFCQYSSHGNWSRSGYWGIKEHYQDTLAPKYLGMKNCVFPYNQIDPPLAMADQDSIMRTASTCIPILQNDTDPNGDSLTVTALIRTPANGTAILQGDTICYTPDNCFSGQDTFWYAVCDPGCPPLCDSSWVIVTVQDAPPTANQDQDSLLENTQRCIPVISNDTDPDGDSLSLNQILQGPANGSANISGDSLCYTPLPGFTGQDTIWYRACYVDCPGICDSAMAIFTVQPDTSTGLEPASGGFSVYPNPAKDYFLVEHNLARPELKVFDLLGRRLPVSTESVGPGKIKIDIRGYQGWALLKIRDRNRSWSRLILISR